MSKEINHGIKHNRSQALIDFAYRFASDAHKNQKRKYTNDPYIVHPVAVAKLVASVTDDCEMIAAALLHDVVEDTEITFDDLMNAGFGYGISQMVCELTDISTPSDGNRAARKEIDRRHIELASPRAKTIKLADLIDNTSSICRHDPGFAKVYMKEKKELLKVLLDGDVDLFYKASVLVQDYFLGRNKT